MKKTLLSATVAMLGMATAANAQTFMQPATLVSPDGLFVSSPPFSVSVTYDNQPLQLIDPSTSDWGEEYVTAYVQFDDGEAMPVSAAILSSFGNPDDPDDPDVWELDVALYELDNLWDFDGNSVTVTLPEGIVMNAAGEINPLQTFRFEIADTFTSYTISPESGSTISDGFKVSIGFEGNPVRYFQSQLTVYAYDPDFTTFTLEYGGEVTINDANEIEIDLSGLSSGFYEIVVPEGFVMVTAGGKDYLSPSLWLEYTIENDGSGVASFEMEDARETIYNLQGVKVNGSSGRGILIVNGKKVIR